jgi:hypothetical protein
VRDALAIVSFLIAGWLVMLIAEVVDNHYLRAFACLCVILGGVVSFKWIFLVDGPVLRELTSGSFGMLMVTIGFWTALAVAAALFILLAIRLVLDKLHAGRRPPQAVAMDVSLGREPIPGSPGPGAGQPRGDELPPIPVDTSPLAVSTESATTARQVGPVSRLVGIGGVYLGNAFDIKPGEISIGRENAGIELSNDNQVSRQHAAINIAPSGVATLSDLGSTNGTHVNNQPITSIELAPGDVIRIGTSLFKVEG